MIGIYKIKNRINNKKYYGSSVDIDKRWGVHKSKLRNSNHGNPHLQNSWNKNGKENFKFEIILLCEEFELEYYEQKFLDNIVKWGFDYNINPKASGGDYWSGKKRSEETRRKISEALKGKLSGENHYFYGKHHTEKSKKKISESKKGTVLSKEHKQKISIANKGKIRTEETKKKIGKSKSGENHPSSKLIKERVLMIRRMYLTSKYTQKILGKLFNISQANITKIINYKTWKHI